jgi:hypothetical protein
MKAQAVELDPVREALSAAISRLDLARKQATEAQAIYARCDEGRWEGHAAVDAAEGGLVLARNDAVDSVSTGREFLSTKAARERLDDATDRLQAIEASEPRLKKAAIDAAGEVAKAQDQIHSAIRDIVAASPAVTRLVTEAEAARKTLNAVHRIREALSNRNVTPDSMRRLELWPGGPADTAEELKWRQALAQLETDAYASLPD